MKLSFILSQYFRHVFGFIYTFVGAWWRDFLELARAVLGLEIYCPEFMDITPKFQVL